MKRDEIDELLNKLRCFYTEERPTSTASMELDHIQYQVGLDLYRAIEDDLSSIMDQYEEYGFNIGFRACFQIMIGLMEDIK